MPQNKAHELTSSMRALVERLANDTDATRQSELFIQYLHCMATFHNYSWHNTMLIYSQKPTATRVAGFRAWNRLNRYVRRGEKGIVILAPMFFKTGAKEVNPETGKESEVRRVWFKPVYVFDLAQTDGEPLPKVDQDAHGEAAELLANLEAFCQSRGIVLEYGATGDALGYSSGGRIRVCDSLSVATQAAVLVHEIAHEMLHWKDRVNKPCLHQRELEAEATAFVVASHFGLDMGKSSFYLATYQITAEQLTSAMDTIQKTSAEIINAVSPTPEPDPIAEVQEAETRAA